MKEIALFPLNIFLLPGDYTQLHIFEERYRQLLHGVREEGFAFGIPYTSRLNTRNYGCLVELEEVVKDYPGGEMDIIVRAVGIFKLEKFYYQKPGFLYPGGLVTILDLPQNAALSPQLQQEFSDYLRRAELEGDELLQKADLSLFEVANALQLNELERMEFLGLQDQQRMENFLRNYIRFLNLLLDQEKHVYQNIYLN